MRNIFTASVITDWSKIAVKDTENRFADSYSVLEQHNVLQLSQHFTTERYIKVQLTLATKV